MNLDNIHFILVEPFSPGNVGSAARAIKTMGFSKLWLVNPCDIQHEDARKLAHASTDILDNAKFFDSLASALADMHFVLAASNREREDRWPTFTPSEVGQKCAELSDKHNIAIVFGREKDGLSNEELRQCHAIATIPAAILHPSLNLSQAVQVFSYAIYNTAPNPDTVFNWELATHLQMESVYEHFEKTMRSLEFEPLDNWERFVMRFKRVFGRANPETRDVQLMHKVLQAVDKYVEYGSAKNKTK